MSIWGTELSVSTITTLNTLDYNPFPNNTDILKLTQITHFNKEMKIGEAYAERFREDSAHVIFIQKKTFHLSIFFSLFPLILKFTSISTI